MIMSGYIRRGGDNAVSEVWKDTGLHQRVRKTGFELQHKRDEYMKKIELHHHDFYELYFLMSGDVIYNIESRLYRVIPGDILVINPRELHKLRVNAQREEYGRYVLWIDAKTVRRLSTKKTDLFRCLNPANPGYSNQLHMSPEEQQHVHGLIHRLYQELQADAYGSDLMPELLLTQLLVAINRIAAGEREPERDAVYSSQMVSSVVEYIGAHYGEELSLEALAEQFYVSKYHLSHEFNRLAGTSVHRYILKKRLLIARQMMAQGKRPSEVWEPCGFGDYTGFYRAFRAEYGTSPKEYVQSILQQ